LAVEEITRVLQLGKDSITVLDSTQKGQKGGAAQGQAGVGKVRFSTSVDAATVQGLRCFQSVYAFLGSSDSLCTEKVGLDSVRSLLSRADWISALDCWQKHLGSHAHPNMIPFRTSCLIDGAHDYDSLEVCASMAATVLEWNRQSPVQWRLELHDFECEIVAFVLDSRVVFGLSLDRSADCADSRLARSRREDLVTIENRGTVLRPSTAYLLAQLAEVRIA
jgi:hypothetical protein